MLGAWALTSVAPGLSMAHHSLSEWDPNVIVELQGEVVEVVWRNPHVRFTIEVVNAAGEDDLWRIAGSSLAHLDRRNVPRDAVEVGDIIRVSGSPSNRRRNNVIAHTMLLADGRELLIRGMGSLGPNVGSIYSDVDCRRKFRLDRGHRGARRRRDLPALEDRPAPRLG